MRQAVYSIQIGGKNVSKDIDPILLSLSIRLTDGTCADELSLELDDSNGQVPIPAMGAPVSAFLYWDEGAEGVEFEGFLDEAGSGGRQHGHRDGYHGGHSGDGSGGGEGAAHSTGSRSKGRVLTVTAKSADMTGDIKAQKQRHADRKSFGDVAKDWGQKSGLSDVKVSDDLASIERPYWAMGNESFMAWGQRMADELGATFKIYGTTGVFVPRSGGAAADGQSLQSITAAWGEDGNLLDWSITPVISRPNFGTFLTRWYDPKAAKWQVEKAEGRGSGSSAKHCHEFKAPAKDHARSRSDSNAKEHGREKGCGDSVTIDGEPAAQPGAVCNVVGIRPGIDGSYLISDVTHSLSKSSGFTTRLTLKQPSGGAGVDDR